MKGILYGIGTGPGDSGLLTLKAQKTVSSCQIIALPHTSKEYCHAYRIIKKSFPEIDSKEILPLDFPMTKDETILKNAHITAAEKICKKLEEGKNVAFITIGDVTIYSTFSYIKNLVEEKNYNTQMVNGIPSFCAAAARLGISLSEQDEEIHIIPGSADLQQAFNLEGTLIFMKSGKRLLELKEFLQKKQTSHYFDFYAVSNCGMENEKIYSKSDELSEDSSYLTTVIIKNIKKKTSEKNYSFFQNQKCEMFPCHQIDDEETFNCLFCYCPLYFLGDKCGGNFTYTAKGIKSCINCNFPHKKENYKKLIDRLKEQKNGSDIY